MADWVNEQASYKVSAQGQPFPAQVEVFGAKDRDGQERPKLVLQDRADNQGPSVMTPQGRNQAIASLSECMNIKPQEADWYARDNDGQMYSVEVGYEKKTVPNRSFQELVQSGDLNHFDLQKAKKHFPDERIDALKSEVKGVDPQKMEQLKESFHSTSFDKQKEDPKQSMNEQPKEKSEQKQEQPPVKSAHEYDLSQERMR